MPNYERPNIPYDNADLPNCDRYQSLGSDPPKAVDFDGDINYCVDRLNDLYQQMQGIAVGILPGSLDPENKLFFPTTNGTEIIWRKVSDDYIEDNAIDGSKITQGTIQATNMANGSIGRNQIIDNEITESKYCDDSIPESAYKDSSIPTGAYQNKSINSDKIGDEQIKNQHISNNSISGQKITDGTLPASKIVDNSITSQQLSGINKPLIGGLTFYPVKTAANPVGYVFANGQALDRKTYAELFAVYGTTFGAGDGNTTFNVIDMRGRVPVGVDYANENTPAATGDRVSTETIISGGLTVGGNGGLEQVTLSETQIPPHTHPNTYAAVNSSSASGGSISTADQRSMDTGSTGGGLPHNNMQPSILGQWLIYIGPTMT